MTEKELKELESKRQPMEVFSRICGYLRPTRFWNDGKVAEYNDRKMYDVKNKKSK